MKLRCVGQYANDARGLRFVVGQVFEPDPDVAAFLLVDAPGCFEQAADEPVGKAAKKPAADKAIHSTATK